LNLFVSKNKNDKQDDFEQRTLCVEFNSSIHGEQRRIECEVTKRDLQAAVKYGTKERTYGRKGEQR
jgi:hypothetical protein